MLQKTTNFFDRLCQKYTPDPFVFAIILTFIIFISGVLWTPSSVNQMTQYWGDGLWALVPFTMQMAMMLIGGYIMATTPPMKKLIALLARQVKNPSQAVLVTSLATSLACWINWGFGLVIGGFLCLEMIKAVPKANFRLLVASAYSGFLVWHGGISGSIPLTIATSGAANFTEKAIGSLIPISDTIFAPFNIMAVLGVGICVSLFNWYMAKNDDVQKETHLKDISQPVSADDKVLYPAQKIERSRVFSLTIAALGMSYLFVKIFRGEFRFDLNGVNFIFLFTGIALHGNLKNFIAAFNQGTSRVGPILLQFPFYAGMMGMMSHSGLAELMSNFFVRISTVETFPLLTFYSAGILNLFIPSGGGQWAVQGPIVIAAAKDLGVDMAKAAMAVAWGDAWTNMLQPFWALPILAISGLRLGDIMGYCVSILVVSGIVLSLVFMFC